VNIVNKSRGAVGGVPVDLEFAGMTEVEHVSSHVSVPVPHPPSPVPCPKGRARIWSLPGSGRDAASVTSRVAFLGGVYCSQIHCTFPHMVFMN